MRLSRSGKQQCRVLDEPGCRPAGTQKTVSEQPAHVWQWQESCRDSMPSSL